MQANEHESFDIDFGAAFAGVLRLGCLLIGLGLLVVGVRSALEVFSQVKTVVTNGQGLEKAVEQIGKAIHAENMSYKDADGNVRFEAGYATSMFFLILWYMLWLAVPLVLIRSATWILGLSFQKK